MIFQVIDEIKNSLEMIRADETKIEGILSGLQVKRQQLTQLIDSKYDSSASASYDSLQDEVDNSESLTIKKIYKNL